MAPHRPKLRRSRTATRRFRPRSTLPTQRVKAARQELAAIEQKIAAHVNPSRRCWIEAPMRRATMTQAASRAMKHDLTANLEAAKRSLGAALLVEEAAPSSPRSKTLAKPERPSQLPGGARDAEAMFLALEESERSRKSRRSSVSRHMLPRAGAATRHPGTVPGKRRKRSRIDYDEIKGTEALLSRGKALLDIAKSCRPDKGG